MNCQPIGVFRTPFKNPGNMPIQPTAARGVVGTIEIRIDLADGLRDLEGFSHVIVLYAFHRQVETRLSVTPFLDDRPHGVFATRAPCRPNPIGLSLLRLVAVKGTILTVEDVDMLDDTPVLDIKPYIPAFDQADAPVRCGWMSTTASNISEARSDSRFCMKE